MVTAQQRAPSPWLCVPKLLLCSSSSGRQLMAVIRHHLKATSSLSSWAVCFPSWTLGKSKTSPREKAKLPPRPEGKPQQTPWLPGSMCPPPRNVPVPMEGLCFCSFRACEMLWKTLTCKPKAQICFTEAFNAIKQGLAHAGPTQPLLSNEWTFQPPAPLALITAEEVLQVFQKSFGLIHLALRCLWDAGCLQSADTCPLRIYLL